MPVQFDPSANTFSIENGYLLAKACLAAYNSDFSPELAELGLQQGDVTFFPGEIHAFVAAAPGFVIVAFRGTDSLQGWLTDGNIAQVQDPAYPGLVHRGFAAALATAWPQIRTLVPALGGVRGLWLTGHSLGGALATLAACRFQAEGVPVQAVYTYGAPRVGDPAFYSGYQTVNYRFVHNNDVVPHLPLEQVVVPVFTPGTIAGALRFGHFVYADVGTLEYLDRFGHLGEGMSDWATKRATILAALARTGGPVEGAEEDHGMQGYIDAIATNLPAPGV